MKTEINNKKVETTGICTLLVIILAILKLFKVITISWWWVFSPWWIPVVFVIGLIVLAGIAMCVWTLIDVFKEFIE